MEHGVSDRSQRVRKGVRVTEVQPTVLTIRRTVFQYLMYSSIAIYRIYQHAAPF